MFRGAAIVFVIGMLLTTVGSSIFTGVVHAQRAPQHVFDGYVSLNRQPLNDGTVRVTAGPGIGLQPPVQEIAHVDIRQGRYKIAVEDPTGGKYSSVMLRFSVTYEGREYQRPREVKLELGKTTKMNFDIEGWLWHQAQPQSIGNPPGRNAEQERERMEREDEERRELERERMEREDNMRREQMDMERERMEREDEERREMERERMDRDEEMRREQMDMERERMEREDEERREMERDRMEMDEEMRREQMDMERERMERESEQRREMERERMEMDEEMRREQMDMERERMGRGQPGVQPEMTNSPKSGPSRGLFSNSKAGEAASGIDNIMDPTTLTIIGIALTVLTTGMTLFKGN